MIIFKKHRFTDEICIHKYRLMIKSFCFEQKQFYGITKAKKKFPQENIRRVRNFYYFFDISTTKKILPDILYCATANQKLLLPNWNISLKIITANTTGQFRDYGLTSIGFIYSQIRWSNLKVVYLYYFEYSQIRRNK